MRKKLLSIMRSNTRIDLIKIMQRRHDITKPTKHSLGIQSPLIRTKTNLTKLHTCHSRVTPDLKLTQMIQ